jgi:uncharacterized membrane protein YjjP (DUF1212 family)
MGVSSGEVGVEPLVWRWARVGTVRVGAVRRLFRRVYRVPGGSVRRTPGLALPVLPPVRLPEPEEREAYRILTFGLRIGASLLSCGAGTADVEDTVVAAVHACGLRDCEVDVTFNSISVSYLRGDDVAPVTSVRVVRRPELDYTRLTEVANLVEDLVQGRVDREAAMARLNASDSAPHPYSRWHVSIASAGLAAAIVVLLGGTAVPALVGAGVALVVDRVKLRLAARDLPGFYQNVCGGALATVIAVVLFWVDVPVAPSLVVSAGIVLLLPGVILVGSVQDAISGFLVTAMARTLEVFLLAAGIISGVALGLYLAVRLKAPVQVLDSAVPLALPPVAAIAAVAGSICFAYTNYAPRRALLSAGLAGGLGYALANLLKSADVPDPLSSGVAAILVGFGSYALAGRQRIPPLILVVPGITPLLPGLTLYRAMFQLTTGEPFTGLLTALEAFSIGVALAAGVIFGELIAQPVRREVDRWERRYAGPRLIRPRRKRPASPPATLKS